MLLRITHRLLFKSVRPSNLQCRLYTSRHSKTVFKHFDEFNQIIPLLKLRPAEESIEEFKNIINTLPHNPIGSPFHKKISTEFTKFLNNHFVPFLKRSDCKDYFTDIVDILLVLRTHGFSSIKFYEFINELIVKNPELLLQEENGRLDVKYLTIAFSMHNLYTRYNRKTMQHKTMNSSMVILEGFLDKHWESHIITGRTTVHDKLLIICALLDRKFPRVNISLENKILTCIKSILEEEYISFEKLFWVLNVVVNATFHQDSEYKAILKMSDELIYKKYQKRKSEKEGNSSIIQDVNILLKNSKKMSIEYPKYHDLLLNELDLQLKTGDDLMNLLGKIETESSDGLQKLILEKMKKIIKKLNADSLATCITLTSKLAIIESQQIDEMMNELILKIKKEYDFPSICSLAKGLDQYFDVASRTSPIYEALADIIIKTDFFTEEITRKLQKNSIAMISLLDKFTRSSLSEYHEVYEKLVFYIEFNGSLDKLNLVNPHIYAQYLEALVLLYTKHILKHVDTRSTSLKQDIVDSKEECPTFVTKTISRHLLKMIQIIKVEECNDKLSRKVQHQVYRILYSLEKFGFWENEADTWAKLVEFFGNKMVKKTTQINLKQPQKKLDSLQFLAESSFAKLKINKIRKNYRYGPYIIDIWASLRNFAIQFIPPEERKLPSALLIEVCLALDNVHVIYLWDSKDFKEFEIYMNTRGFREPIKPIFQ